MHIPRLGEATGIQFPTQCLIFLKGTGLWPLSVTENETGISKAVRIFLRWVSLTTIIMITCSTTLYEKSVIGNLPLMVDVACTNSMGILMGTRLFHLQWNQTKFRNIIELFARDIWIPSDTYPHLERECRRKMRPYVVMAWLMFILIIIYCVVPLIEATHLGWASDQKPFPFPMIFLYDAQQKWSYIITYFIAFHSASAGGAILVAEDSMIGFFITYTDAQYQILHERIDNMLQTVYQRHRRQYRHVNEALLQQDYLRELNEVAFKHNKLIEFIKAMEEFWSFTMLQNFFLSTVLLCIVAFQLATAKGKLMADYVKFAVYICQTLTQLFILCWNGDRLLQITSATGSHLYNCKWEGAYLDGEGERFIAPAREFRQNLRIMQLCGQKPVGVTAGKFAILSLQSFLGVISSSMSYFAVLRTLNE